MGEQNEKQTNKVNVAWRALASADYGSLRQGIKALKPAEAKKLAELWPNLGAFIEHRSRAAYAPAIYIDQPLADWPKAWRNDGTGWRCGECGRDNDSNETEGWAGGEANVAEYERLFARMRSEQTADDGEFIYDLMYPVRCSRCGQLTMIYSEASHKDDE